MKREGSKKQRHKRGKPEPGSKLSGPLDEDDLDEEELGDFYDDFPWMESVLKVLPGRAVSQGCLSTTTGHQQPSGQQLVLPAVLRRLTLV